VYIVMPSSVFVILLHFLPCDCVCIFGVRGVVRNILQLTEMGRTTEAFQKHNSITAGATVVRNCSKKRRLGHHCFSILCEYFTFSFHHKKKVVQYSSIFESVIFAGKHTTCHIIFRHSLETEGTPKSQSLRLVPPVRLKQPSICRIQAKHVRTIARS